MSSNKSIDEEMIEVYHAWDYVSKEKARDMLKKMSFQKINDSTDIEDKRLIFHNLATVIMKIGEDKNSAKYYSKLVKDMLDSYPNYKDNQTNKERYCRALNNYTECYKDELTTEELKEIYKFHYETYKNYNYDEEHVDEYREKLIAQFNLNLLKRNFILVLNTVKDMIIHNNNSQYEEALQSFINDIKDKDDVLYSQVLLLEENIQVKIS